MYQLPNTTHTNMFRQMIINIFIQARMSSNRFPGKILAPFKDKPMIKHLIDNVSLISNKNKVVVIDWTKDERRENYFFVKMYRNFFL